MSRLLSPHPGGTRQDSCSIHPTDIKGLRVNSSVAYLRDRSITELLGTDNCLWLEHDECFCAAEVPQSVSEQIAGYDFSVLTVFLWCLLSHNISKQIINRDSTMLSAFTLLLCANENSRTDRTDNFKGLEEVLSMQFISLVYIGYTMVERGILLHFFRRSHCTITEEPMLLI